jgi:hypothetical protein
LVKIKTAQLSINYTILPGTKTIEATVYKLFTLFFSFFLFLFFEQEEMCGSEDCALNEMNAWQCIAGKEKVCARQHFETRKETWLRGENTEHIFVGAEQCFDPEDDDFEFLKHIQVDKLEVLIIKCPKVTDTVGMYIADIIDRSDSIYTVRLTSEHVTEASCAAIATALHKNTSLSYLHVSNTENELNRDGVLKVMVAALEINPNRPLCSRWAFCSVDYQVVNDYEYARRKAESHTSNTQSRAERLLRPERHSEKRMRKITKTTRQCFARLRGELIEN